MLLEILGAIAIGAVGYNALKDEESRKETKKTIRNFGNAMNKTVERKYQNGEISDEEYRKFKNNYRRMK